MSRQEQDPKNPFEKFEPVLWKPEGERFDDAGIYSTMRQHGVDGEIIYHNLNDEINRELPYLDKILLEYRIKEQGYVIYTVRDFFEVTYQFSENGIGNIMGDLGERIARRVTKYFLKHLSSEGVTGGIFDRRFNPKNKNGYIVTNTDEYILKIQNYPNLIILRREESGPWEYNSIKELDGLFDYRYKGERHIIVLESKIDKHQIDKHVLMKNLFKPLGKLFPEARFHYVLFASRHAIFKPIGKYKMLRSNPVEIYHHLKKHGVGTLFLEFNENRGEFDTMANHLITQYLRLGRRDVEFDGRIVMNNTRIQLYDEGEGPFLSLERDPGSGMWKEVPPKR